MKRLLRASGAHLTLLFLAVVGSFAALMLVWIGGPVSADRVDSPAEIGAAAPPGGVLASQYVPGISCTLSITTEQDFTYQDISTGWPNAASFPALATYNYELALSFGDVPASSQKYPAFDEYFRLDNATVGASYEIDVVPDYTDNYNLGLIIYNSGFGPIMNDTNSADNRSASLTLVPDSVGPYYFRVVQLTPFCTGRTYSLRVTYTGPTATPTRTPSSTPTPSVTPTSTPAWEQQDSDEPNEDINSPKDLVNPTGRTFFNNTSGYADPRDDNDWYRIYGAAGYQYTVSAARDNGTTDLYFFMEIYAPDKTNRIGIVDSSTNPSINWTASTSGLHYIHIRRATGSPTNSTYKITLTTNAPPTPTFTATPGGGDPTETPIPGADIFEPNYDFEHAGGIGLNVKYTNLNFVPTLGGTVDNDFYKLRVKRGMLVTCETLDLSAGTDTNMILYRDDQAGSCKNRPVLTCEGLAGNDDVDTARGELRSRLTVSIDFDGFLYALVGQGYNIPPGQASQYTYALQCTSGSPNMTSTPAPPTWTPRPPPVVGPTVPPPPPTVPSSATPLPSPVPVISVRPLATSTPSGPPQQIVTADLRVSYDANGNGSADPGEGVVGLPVRVYDDTTGALLAQGFTDDTGHAVFSVPSAGPIRVVVPYLSFETVVPPSGAAIPVLISPRELPEQIP